MRFCKSCGKELTGNYSFCTNCGAAISKEEVVLNTEEEEVVVVLSNTEEKEEINEKADVKKSKEQEPIKFSKKQKIAILIIGIIGILSFAGYKVGEKLTSKEKTIEKFTEALVTNDAEKMLDYVVSADPNLKVTAENLQVTLNYLDENKSYVQEILNSIEEETLYLDKKDDKAYDEVSTSTEVSDEYVDSSIFTLKKQGKKFNIFDNYVIEVRPVYFQLSTNLENTELYMGEELIYTSDQENFSKEFGPYMPGTYEMKAVYKGEYTNLEQIEEVNLYESDYYDESISVELYIDADYINLGFNYGDEDAKLFINDINTNITISEAENFGPVNEGAKIYAIKNVNGKEIKSEELIYNGEYFMYLEFPMYTEETSYNSNNSSSYKKPSFTNISSSSELQEEDYYHKDQNVTDNDSETAWVEGRSGSGVGEWIKFESDEEQTVSSFSIINGYSMDKDVYYDNNRVKQLEVEYSDGTMSVLDFSDNLLGEQTIELDAPKETTYLKFTILDIYDGSKYNDTCISEIEIN